MFVFKICSFPSSTIHSIYERLSIDLGEWLQWWLYWISSFSLGNPYLHLPRVEYIVTSRCWNKSDIAGLFKQFFFSGAWVAQWVKPLPSAQVMISGSWDRVRHRALCSAGSLLPPSLPACFWSLSLPLSLSLCQINKSILKKFFSNQISREMWKRKGIC